MQTYIEYIIFEKPELKQFECRFTTDIYKLSFFDRKNIPHTPLDLLSLYIPEKYRQNIVETGIFEIKKARCLAQYQDSDYKKGYENIIPSLVKLTFAARTK